MTGEPEPATEAWLITGIPGAGKTTIARALARRLPRSAHVEGDVVLEMVRGGLVLPGSVPRDEEVRQLRLAVTNQCLLARSFAAAGFVPVMDFVVVEPVRLEEYRSQLGPLALNLVVLAPARSVALERDRDRPNKTVGDRFEHLDRDLRSKLAGFGLWLDTGKLSVEATVREILAGAKEARLVAQPPPSATS